MQLDGILIPQTCGTHTTQVFGPAASQGDLYDKAIVPIVDEVLEGFNCTIFAYGQTGTGKTYTMQGESSKSLEGGLLSRDAGVIPRSIRQIFDHLDKMRAESSVRVSFLEVYNEELTDLLVVDDGGESRQKLKILDDKNGVVVHGLETFIVKNAADIYQVSLCYVLQPVDSLCRLHPRVLAAFAVLPQVSSVDSAHLILGEILSPGQSLRLL